MDALSNVSDTLLQEVVKLEIDVKPTGQFHAWLQAKGLAPKKRVFEMRPAVLGTLHRISKLLLSVDLNIDKEAMLESNYRLMEQHGETIALVCATALSNTKVPPSSRLVDFLLYNLTSKELLSLLSIVLKQMDISSFMISITSMRGLSVLERKEVSPSVQGS